jgi:hypothetical protein
MMQRFFQYFFVAVLFLGILSMESVVGLPLWFCVIWGAWIEHRSAETQIGWTAVAGIILGTLFLLPFSLGIIVLVIFLGLLHLSKRVIKQEAVRLLLASEVVVILLAFATHLVWTPERIGAHFLKLVATCLIVSVVLARTNQRQGLGLSLHVQKK